MDELAIVNAVQEAFARKRPDWSNVRVTEIAPAPRAGHLAVVVGMMPDDEEDKEIDGDENFEAEEIVYISSNLKVRIFDGSADLINNIGSTGNWHLQVLSASGISGMAFLITLIAVVAAAFLKLPDSKALDTLFAMLALAAGFYFGNQAKRS